MILIGEIRDQLTMSIALTAANTGHLVLSTLHTVDASQAVNRIISFFPPHQHQEIRFLMADLPRRRSSRCAWSRREDGKGRVPATEVMLATGTVKEYLADASRTHLIKNVIEESTTEYGMQSFDQSLLSWYNRGVISLEDALRYASSPTALQIKAKGIETGSEASWAPFDGVEDVQEDSDSQSRRDSPQGDTGPARRWASARSPCTPRPTATPST